MTSLRAEMSAVETEYPGWHLWLSDAGKVWATHVLTAVEMTVAVLAAGPFVADAVTVTAPTPALARHEIACCARHLGGAA